MAVFESQFARLAAFSAAYVGSADTAALIAPESVDAAAIASQAAATLGPDYAAAMEAAGAYEVGAGFDGFTSPAEGVEPNGFTAPEPWMERGSYTDMGVGGDSSGMYVIGDGFSWSAF